MAKKLMTTLLVALMCIALLCACTPNNPSETPNQSDDKGNVDPNPSGNQDDANSTGDQVEPEPSTGEDEPDIKTIKVSDYLGNADAWEDDGGDVTISAEKILFSNFYAGDFSSVRLTEAAADATWEYTVQVKKIPEGLSEDAGDWWDAEFLTVIRSALPGGSYLDGEQTGYTITSWGDLSTVYIGRAGYDDAFGYVAWPIGDGQPHVISFTAENNEDNTVVHLTLAVDGEVVFECDDDGSLVKKERVSLYPDAGGLTLRCKYLEVEVY